MIDVIDDSGLLPRSSKDCTLLKAVEIFSKISYNNSTLFLNCCAFDNVSCGAVECDDTNSAGNATISQIPIWPMIETPRAILSSLSISSHPSIHGLLLGTNDLAKDLNLGKCGNSNTREGLVTSLQMTVLAARANGKFVIDGVYNNFRHGDGLYQECMQGKTWGMDGKTLKPKSSKDC